MPDFVANWRSAPYHRLMLVSEGLSHLPNLAWTDQERVYRGLLCSESEPVEISTSLEDYFIALSKRRARDHPALCIAFSGGVDSTLLAMSASNIGDFFTLAADSSAKDAIRSRRVSSALGIECEMVSVNEDLLIKTISRHKSLLRELPNYTHRILAVCEIILCGVASRRLQCLVTGHGPEAVLGGFRRHPTPSLADSDTIWNSLAANVSRLNLVAKAADCEIHLPFLHPSVFSTLCRHSATLQHCNSNAGDVAMLQSDEKSANNAGDVAKWQSDDPKSALQNGSGAHRLIVRAAKRSGFRFVRDYFESLLT